MTIIQLAYLLSSFFAFLSIFLKFKEIMTSIKLGKCLIINDVFTSLSLAIMFSLKIPYLWDKLIARITLIIIAILWFIIAFVQYYFLKLKSE